MAFAFRVCTGWVTYNTRMDTTNLNQSGIYAITSPSGKRYIGSAVNIGKRWREHRRGLSKGKHHCAALQRAYAKYDGHFEWSVLVLCQKEDLLREEQQQMDWAATGTLYNSSLTAGRPLGMKHSDETKAKVAAARRGTRASEQTRAKMAAGQLGKVKRNNTSGFAGVSWDARGKVWRSSRRLCGKMVNLGCWPTAEFAHLARQNFDRLLRFYDSSWTEL